MSDRRSDDSGVNASASAGRQRLRAIARRVMIDRGLLPDFSPAAVAQIAGLAGPAIEAGPSIRDLRGLWWVSIDNDDSRDLDQLSVAEAWPRGRSRGYWSRLPTSMSW